MADNLAKFQTDAYVPDRLIAHDADDLISDQITLITGQNLARGSLLGKITIGAAVAAAKGGGNTGNGTLVMDVVTPILVGCQVGVYQVRCVEAVANGGKFTVVGPDGKLVGYIIIPAGAGNNIAFADQIKFVLTDGAADFIVGDGFDVTVAAGSGKYTLSLAAAVDGSATPDAVLSEDTDATLADKLTVAYKAGCFNSNAMTFGAGQTAANTKDALRAKGIYTLAATAA